MTWVALAPMVKAGPKNHFLYDVAEAVQAGFVDTLKEAVAELRDSASPRLLEALEKKDVRAVLDAFDFRRFETSLENGWRYWLWKGLVEAGLETAARLPRIAKQEEGYRSFVGTNPRAVNWARRHAAKLVVEVSTETRKALRSVITEGIKSKKHPFVLMTDIREVVGLNSRQARAVVNYRGRLIEQGLEPDRIDSLVAKYAERQHKWRGENIARTESMVAAAEGQREKWRQLVDEGLILEDEAQRRWIVSASDRMCPRCAAMAGATAPINGEYPNGSSGPPLHPSCMCVEGLVYRDKEVEPEEKPKARPAEAFIPAKTKKEAEEYAKRFLTNRHPQTGRRMSGKADYRHLSLDQANQMNKTLTDLFDKFKFEPLCEIKGTLEDDAGFNTVLNRVSIGKDVCYTFKTGHYLEDQLRSLRTLQAMGRSLPEDRRAVQAIEKTLAHIRAGRRDCYDAHSAFSFPEDDLTPVVQHEMGHALLDQRSRSWQSLLRDLGYEGNARSQLEAILAEYRDSLPTLRATDHYHEMVAECFVLYLKGGKARAKIPAPLIKCFEEALR